MSQNRKYSASNLDKDLSGFISVQGIKAQPKVTECQKSTGSSVCKMIGKEITKPPTKLFKKYCTPQFKEMSKSVIKADNIHTPETKSSNSSICEVIDVDNPLKMDFLGVDYKETYKNDEQTFQNQLEYLRVKRHMNTKSIKANMPSYLAEQKSNTMKKVPSLLDVTYDYDSNEERVTNPSLHGGDSEIKIPSPPRVETPRLAKLFRTEKKPFNISLVEMEETFRRDRYENLFIEKKEKDIEEKKLEEIKAEAKKKDLVREMATNKFKDMTLQFEKQKREDEKALMKAYLELKRVQKGKIYPHTIKETLQFKHFLKKQKIELKEKSLVKEDFYKDLGVVKRYKETELDISSISASEEKISEMSTDDEDNIKVGQKTKESSQYFLRGFHFKMGKEPRGKLHQKEKGGGGRAPRTCMTRTEWFDDVAPKQKREKSDTQNISLLKKEQDPDDPSLRLFPQHLGKANIRDLSPVREYRKQPLRELRKRTSEMKIIHIKKPKKGTKVRNFNMTGFLYGKDDFASKHSDEEHKAEGTLNDYVNEKEFLIKKRRIKKRMERCHYLKIKLPPKIRKSKQLCVDSVSSDSDWIPDKEDSVEGSYAERLSILRTGGKFAMPIIHGVEELKYNMPAPDFRETTLQRNPKNPRDYENEHISDEEIYNYLKKSIKPLMLKIENDRKNIENVDKKKTVYGKIFDARRHHDHWDPTQHKVVDVKYKTKDAFPRLQDPNIEKSYFEKNTEIVEDKAMLKNPTDEKLGSLMEGYEKIHSRNPEDFLPRYYGRQEFLGLIKDINAELKTRSRPKEEGGKEPLFEKDDYLKEIENDLKSIKSCLSSLDSSINTNFTNDSGSFVMLEKHKVPLDYLRKSVVPFNEINRVRLKAKPIPPVQFRDPFETVPFAGQKQEQYKLSKPKDKIHTFNTRIQAERTLRQDLKTQGDFKDLMGYKREVATDVDELYIEDLNTGAQVKNFKPASMRLILKNSLRKRFEGWVIEQKVVEQKIAEKKEEIYANQVVKFKLMLNKLFLKWEKKEYEYSMKYVNKIKPYVDATVVYEQMNQDLSKYSRNSLYL